MLGDSVFDDDDCSDYQEGDSGWDSGPYCQHFVCPESCD